MEHVIAPMYIQINGERVLVGGMPPVSRCELQKVIVDFQLEQYTTFPFKWIMTQRMFGMLKGFYEAGSNMCAAHLFTTEEGAAGRDGFYDVVGFKDLVLVDLEARAETTSSVIAMKHTGENYVTLSRNSMQAIIEAIETALRPIEYPEFGVQTK